MGRDQNDNACRVTERGAGLRLAPDASAEEIAAAARRLLDEPSFRAASTALGAAIRREMSPEAAAREVELLAAPATKLRMAG